MYPQEPDFVVAVTGAIMTMPGLPKKPAAYSIDVNDNGNDHRIILRRKLWHRLLTEKYFTGDQR